MGTLKECSFGNQENKNKKLLAIFIYIGFNLSAMWTLTDT